MALGSGLSHPRSANGLPRVRPRGHRTQRATPAPGTGTPRTGHILAFTTRCRGPPSPAWGPVTVAVTTVAELGDLTRFDNPKQLMKFLGLIPSEYSTGSDAGRVDHLSRQHACTSRARGRCLGLPLSRQSQPASPTPAWNNTAKRSRTSAGKPR